MTFRQFEIDDVMKEHYRSARWTIAWFTKSGKFIKDKEL